MIFIPQRPQCHKLFSIHTFVEHDGIEFPGVLLGVGDLLLKALDDFRVVRSEMRIKRVQVDEIVLQQQSSDAVEGRGRLRGGRGFFVFR